MSRRDTFDVPGTQCGVRLRRIADVQRQRLRQPRTVCHLPLFSYTFWLCSADYHSAWAGADPAVWEPRCPEGTRSTSPTPTRSAPSAHCRRSKATSAPAQDFLTLSFVFINIPGSFVDFSMSETRFRAGDQEFHHLPPHRIEVSAGFHPASRPISAD
jgi:hypothetical protein